MAAVVLEAGLPAPRDRAAGWACGIVYALGQVNFLSDPTQTPCMTGEQIAKGFGVSPATMHAKWRIIREQLDLIPMDPEWCLPSRLKDNPLVWMIEVDGIILDLRAFPREVQQKAFEMGLIPFVPADEDDGEDEHGPDSDGIIGRIGRQRWHHRTDWTALITASGRSRHR